MEYTTYNCLLIGDPNVGKTAFVRAMREKYFQPKYIPTYGMSPTNKFINTTNGIYNFMLWDTTGQENLGGLKNGFIVESDCAIIFFDLNNIPSCDCVPMWKSMFQAFFPSVPVIIVGNKSDLEKKVAPGDYIEISCKTGANISQPLLELARLLSNDNTIEYA